MKKIKLLNSFIIVTLVFLICLSFVFDVSAATSGIGIVKNTYSRQIITGVNYTYVQSDNGQPQRNYVLEYDPKTAPVEALAVFGEYEFGGDTISTNIALAESKGYTVIAGVNASPFDTSNGVTVGTIIQKGKLISANNGKSSYDSFAIYNSGNMFIGTSNLDMSFTVNGGSPITLNHVNKQKKTANNETYLISEEYYSDTRILADSVEIVLNIEQGNLKIGDKLVCKVESINQSASASSRTKTAKGKVILVGNDIASLGNAKVGDNVTFSFKNLDTSHEWDKVSESICGFYEILKDGEIVNGSDPSVHPRTTIGYKADGTIVLFVVDGRQPTFSVGLTDKACAEYMKSLGCVAAIRMDGGGSSNMTIRLPGDTKLTTVNSPSDGEERHDSDALLLVLKSDYDTNPGNETILHAYPNTLNVLENTIVDVVIKATDNKYNPKAVPDYELTVEGGCGTIVGKQFKACSGEGQGYIVATSGSVSTKIKVKVSSNVDELYSTVNNLALSPGDVRQLGVKAYYKNDLLECSNESFKWSCDKNIGTIDEHGKFTASQNAGVTGYITVKYGTVSAKVLVTLGALPVEITGFENDSAGRQSGQWRNDQVNGGSGSCSINEDLQYVRYGSKSLKIDFNLANTTGTVGTQINNGGLIKISGTPTAIGMWVYATESAQGAWIRMQYQENGSTAAKYADFTVDGEKLDEGNSDLYVNWVGWKYLEAPIDSNLKFPISIKYLVRVMGVSETQRINGTIYVDNLRAIYGFKNDDFVYPVVSNITPSENGATNVTTQTISFDVVDNETGVNKEATKFYLDNTEITNLNIQDISGGYRVSWTPSALVPLNVGEHKIKIRVEDNSGNFISKEWNLTVDTSLPQITSSSVEQIDVGNEFEYTINASNNQFSSSSFDIVYNPNELEVINITNGNETTKGRIHVEGQPGTELSTITFKALKVGIVSIKVEDGEYKSKADAVIKFIVPNAEVEIIGKSDKNAFETAYNAIDKNKVLLSRNNIAKAYQEMNSLKSGIIEQNVIDDVNSLANELNQKIIQVSSVYDEALDVLGLLGGE